MEQLRLKAIATVLFAGFTINASAGYKVVFDPWTTAQVTANAAAQEAIENRHNERLDTISAKQQKILQYTATMETIKELYSLSMTNIRGFGEETAYYGEIAELSAGILTDVPTVMKFIAQNPGKNYVLCLNELTGVVLETESLVSDFVDIVNNGKVVNPLKKKKNAKSSNDGYNYMDRYTRLTLANRIYGRLLTIRHKMDAMVMMCRFGTWKDMFFAIDPESWAAVYQATNLADGLIMDWNRLDI